MRTKKRLLNKRVLAGRKDDQGKPTLGLIPSEAIWAMGAAFSAGERKYGRYNWCNGLSVVRLCSGGLRHVFQFLAGEDVDQETGVHHLGCALANLSMAIAMHTRRLDLDDRYKKNKEFKR